MLGIPFLEGESPFSFTTIFAHNMDQVILKLGPMVFSEEIGGPAGIFSVTKYTLNLWVASALLLLCVIVAQKTSAIPKGVFRFLFEKLFLFIRDELVYPTMGAKHGKAFLPFFMTVFSLILTLNLVGMVPLPVIGGATTSNLGFTLPIALSVLVVSIGGGLMVNGPGGFIKSFIPSGLPTAIVPVIFLLELAGFFIKHSVLAVRLFANMLGGHLVTGAFLGLIFLFQSYGMSAVSVPMALFIGFIELLVAFLQAYVFTLLAVLFIGGTVHPDH